MSKKEPDFEIADHFKGDFKKECPVINNAEDYFKHFESPQAFDFVSNNGSELQPWDLQIGFNPVAGPVPKRNEEETWLETPSIECTHEPIDVGFSKSKMVCKKCDQDL